MAKRKKPSILRTTISIPYGLKERMDAAEEPVNWSSVAAMAFERKLGELAAKKRKKSINDVIQRLRASRQRVDSEQYTAGERAGRAWAEETAEADELDRLTRMRDRCASDWDGAFEEDHDSDYTVAEWLHFQVRPEDDGDRSGAKDFWEMVVGNEKAVTDPRFVRGFCEGALAVWDEVKDRL